jgi:actin-related protein
MAASPSLDLRKTSLTINRTRPAASTIQTDGSARSPHTPLSRSVSGLYGSPGSSFRVDEENLLIFDFGTRLLRAGFAGEPSPRCRIAYTPNLWRRVGDYREYDEEYEAGKQNNEEYELWRPDVRDLDLGLVEDKIERLIRECENKFLMLDSRTKRVGLVVSSTLPRPLVSLMLKRFFEGLQAPTVTLLPSSVMVTVAAGLRSALVVDVGWYETNITAVCEYREVSQNRSIRAGKMLAGEFGKVLEEELGKASKPDDDDLEDVRFEEAEEVMMRVGWCRDTRTLSDDVDYSTPISIPLRQKTLQVPFARLSVPADIALFATKPNQENDDDHNLPLHKLIYNTLLALPIDIRHICMSRILITGGPSSMPGLKHRILHDVEDLVKERGWDPVINYGSAKKMAQRRTVLKERNGNVQSQTADTKAGEKKLSERRTSSSSTETEQESLPPSAQPQEADPIMDKLIARSNLSSVPGPSLTEPVLKILQTLGPWAGASLITNLRIRGAVEIEKDRFLQLGLVGGAALTGKGGSVVPERSRQSLAPGAKEKGGWSLGVWA